MRAWSRLASLFRNLFRRRHVERDLDDELRAYVEMAVEERVRAGSSQTDARRAVLIEVGSTDAVKENVRDIRAGAILDQIGQDVVYALRMLRKNPGFTVVAVGSLALGIGATTAVCRLLDALFLRPLPVPRVERVMRLLERPERSMGAITWQELDGYRQRASSVFSGVAGYQTNLGRRNSVLARRGQETFEVDVSPVSGDYFATLSLRPDLGRLLSRDDDREPGTHPVAVLTHSSWVRRCHAERNAVGDTIVLNGIPFTVVGVAPPGFRGLSLQMEPDVFVPVGMGKWVDPRADRKRPWRDPYAYWPVVVGRLRDGVSPAQAEIVLTRIARELAVAGGRSPEVTIALQPAAMAAPGVEPAALKQLTAFLLAVAGTCLLIASFNVAGLLLARAIERRREIGLRLALGATRARIIRQLIVEGALLASIAGLAGLLVTTAMFRMLHGFRLPGWVEVHTLGLGVDLSVFMTTIATAVLACISFSLVPTWHARGIDLRAAIAAHGAGPGQRPSRTRGTLLAAQVALCLPLLVGAGLLLRTLHRAVRIDLGFDPKGVLTVEFPGMPPERAAATNQRLAVLTRRMAGVEAVDTSTSCCGYHASTFYVDGVRRHIGNDNSVDWVGPDYFRAMGIRLLRGRAISPTDVEGAPRVAVVNESFARSLWPNQDAIGHRFGCGMVSHSESKARTETMEVVGVVSDARYIRLKDTTTKPRFYVPLAQAGPQMHGETLIVRARATDVHRVVESLITTIRALDALAPPEIRLWSDIAYAQLMPQKLGALLLVIFGGVALGLSAVGLYGLLAYVIGQRRAEIGVRVALGASRRDVIALVLRQGTILLGTGLIVGLLLSAWAARLLERFVFGVPSGDPGTLAAATVVLGGAGLLACYIPARRAARIDPMVALRAE